MKNIGMQIQVKRQELGWSMETLASKVGISYKTVMNIEHGKDATTRVLLALCDALGLEVSLNNKEE